MSCTASFNPKMARFSFWLTGSVCVSSLLVVFFPLHPFLLDLFLPLVLLQKKKFFLSVLSSCYVTLVNSMFLMKN